MIRAGWRQTSATEYAVQLDGWSAAREPLAVAMAAAIATWVPYFGTHKLWSAQALEAVHDDPILQEGRAHFASWLRATHPEWLAPPP